MARLSVAVALALLFFFFAFSPSVARIQISKPKYDAIIHQLTNPLPASDVKPSPRLPSQSNKVKIHPAAEPPRLELDGKVIRPHQKIKPIQKPLDSNGQKAQPVEKLSDPNGQKAQLVHRRAESNVKKNMKPVVHLPYLALPIKHRSDSIALKNQSELTIKPQPEKNNEERKVFQLRSEVDLIMKAQPESNGEQSKPIEIQPEPEPNAGEAQPVEPATVEALPLKDVSFRVRSKLPYRLCRHSHLHHIEENIPSRSSQEEIPYGNDMMIKLAENGDFDEDVFHGSFNHVPPKMSPFLHRHRPRPHHLRQNVINVEEVSKHLPKIAHDKKVSYLLAEDDREKASNRLPENSDHGSARRVLPKSIPFLRRNGPHHFRQHVVATGKVSNRLPENNHGRVSHLPRKWIPFLHQLRPLNIHQHNVNEEKKVKDHEKPKNSHAEKKRQRSEKKESNLRKRIRKFLGNYFD